ncbi:MAG: hypothetical protein ACLSB7_07815 [Parabacteroides distasonis]
MRTRGAGTFSLATPPPVYGRNPRDRKRPSPLSGTYYYEEVINSSSAS